MKKTETVQLLAVVNAAFPNMQVTEAMVSLWHELLGDLDFGIAKMAVKKLILESPYPPTIADVRKRAVEITTLPEERIDASEAWGEVMKAIRFYGYYREAEAMESMPPMVAKVAKYMGWQEICHSERPDVVRGQFLRMYETVANREKQDRLLPVAMRDEIRRLAEGMSMKMIEEGPESEWIS